MPDANSVSQRPYIHCVVYGAPGHGKSTFFATFPKPMLVLQTDPFGKEGPYLRRGVAGPVLDYDWFMHQTVYSRRDEQKQIIRIEFFSDEDPRKPGCHRDLQQRFDTVVEEVREGQWATVVIDGVTFLELRARKHYQYVETKGKEPRRWYAQSTDDLEELLTLRAGALRCNVCVAAHVDADYDEVMGHRVHNPAAPGRMRTRFGAGFPELYVAHAMSDPKGGAPRYWLQTRTDSRYAAASVFLNAPDPCEPTYNALWENFDALSAETGATAPEKEES